MPSKFNHANFAIGTVSGTFTSDQTTLDLVAGHGNRFPTAPFRVTLWNATDYTNPADAFWSGSGDAEIIECGGKTSSSLTSVVRGCEGTYGIIHKEGKIYRVTCSFTLADLLYTYGDVRNVLSYGADPTGVNNSVAAIQAAITAAAITGGIVFCPPGVYWINDTLRMAKGVELRGASEDTTIINYTGSGNAVLADGSSAGLTWKGKISNLKITTATGTIGIKIQDLVDYELNRVWVRGFSTAGVNLNASAHYALSTRILNSIIEENTGDGVLATGLNAAVNHIIIRDSRVRGNGGWGINTAIDIRNWVIEGNDLEGNTAGCISTMWAQGLSVHGNYGECASTAPFLKIQPTSAGLTPSGISVIGNEIIGAATSAIIVGSNGLTYGVCGVEISGNTFHGTWTYCIDPVDIRGGTISGNSYLSPLVLVNTPGINTVNLSIVDKGYTKIAAGGLEVSSGNLSLAGAWNNGHLVLGSYHIWVDGTGDIRIKSGAPTSDTDGAVIGDQAA